MLVQLVLNVDEGFLMLDVLAAICRAMVMHANKECIVVVGLRAENDLINDVYMKVIAGFCTCCFGF